MSNVLDFILRLQNMLTPGMRQAVRDNSTATAQLASQFQNVQQSGRRLGGSINELRQRLDGLNKVRFATTYVREFDTATRAARQLEREIDRLENKGKNGIGSTIAGLGIGAAIFGTGKSALMQDAMMENQKIAFKVLTGSAGFGNNLYKDIVKMADVTPFESQELARGGKTLLGYGENRNMIMPDLKMLGEVASAQDNPAESLQSLSLAFGQVVAKGHLAGQEVLQMVNAGFNPLKEISDMTGRSMADLEKIMEKGGITADTLRQAFQHATGAGGKFHDMMLLQSQTLGGQWSTFMDLVHSKLRGLGELLAPLAKGVMQFASTILNSVPALIALAGGVAALGYAALSAVPGIEAFTTAFLESPFAIAGAIAIGVGLLIGAIMHFTKKTNSLSAEYVQLADKANMVADMHKAAANAVSDNVAKAGMLLGVIQDENMQQAVRIEKLKELQKLDKDHFGALTLATSSTDAARKSLADYTAEMWRHAEAMAAVDKYKQLVAQKLDTEMKIHDQVAKTVYGGTDKNLNARGTIKDQFNPQFIRAADQETQRKMDEAKQLAPVNAAFNSATAFLLGRIKGDKGATDALGKDGAGGSGGGNGGINLDLGKDINKGGQRTTTINIGKQIEKVEMHVANAKESVEEIASMIRQELRKTMYSLNGETAN